MVVMIAVLVSLIRWGNFNPDQKTIFLLLPILYLTLVHTVYFGDDRYHLPILPLLAILSTGPLQRLLVSIQTNRSGVLQ
jgi:hypothetical protein